MQMAEYHDDTRALRRVQETGDRTGKYNDAHNLATEYKEQAHMSG